LFSLFSLLLLQVAVFTSGITLERVQLVQLVPLAIIKVQHAPLQQTLFALIAMMVFMVLLIVPFALATPLLLVVNAKMNIFLTLLTQPALTAKLVLLINIARVVALTQAIPSAPTVQIALLALVRRLIHGFGIAVLDVLDARILCALIARLVPRV